MDSTMKDDETNEPSQGSTMPETGYDEDGRPRTWFDILAESCRCVNELESTYSMDVSHI